MDPSKKKKPVTRTTFLKKAGSQMVDIRVGKELKLFRVHKSLLCTRVPYFDKMFNSGFSESTTNSTVLQEDDHEAFDVLVDWVYTNRLPPEGSFWDPVEVYILADKICLPELMDQVMDRIEAECLLSPAGALNIYRRLPNGSMLRVFAIHLITFEFCSSIQFNLPSRLNVDAKNEEFATDFLNHIRRYIYQPKVIPRPKQRNRCEFHCHEEKTCTLTGKTQK